MNEQRESSRRGYSRDLGVGGGARGFVKRSGLVGLETFRLWVKKKSPQGTIGF